MVSLVLSTTTKFLLPILLLFSLFLTLRGHNKPGGGFVGGLVAAAAFSLYAMAYDTSSARALLRIDPHTLIGLGLLAALSSGLWSWLAGTPFMTGHWVNFNLPGIGMAYIGTPVLFDVGVYLTVMGVAVLDVFSLAEE